jgi:hypothetical protein
VNLLRGSGRLFEGDLAQRLCFDVVLEKENRDFRKVSSTVCGRSLVWSRTSACHADDPGSNLGDRTMLSVPERRMPLLFLCHTNKVVME